MNEHVVASRADSIWYFAEEERRLSDPSVNFVIIYFIRLTARKTGRDLVRDQRDALSFTIVMKVCKLRRSLRFVRPVNDDCFMTELLNPGERRR